MSHRSSLYRSGYAIFVLWLISPHIGPNSTQRATISDKRSSKLRLQTAPALRLPRQNTQSPVLSPRYPKPSLQHLLSVQRSCYKYAVPLNSAAANVPNVGTLQIQGQGGNEQKYKGVLDVVRGLYREGGIRSIFRGTGATLARDGPGSAA